MGGKVSKLWARLTERPAMARKTYWVLFCLGSLATSLLLVGVLNEFRGHPRFVALLSRLVSGPAYALWQNGGSFDWNVWEAIMLYSTVQWAIVCLIGYIVLAAAPRLSSAILMKTALALVCVVGLSCAKTPVSPEEEMFEVMRWFDAGNERTREP